MTIFATRAWLETGWAQDVRLTVTDQIITDITAGAKAGENDVRVDTLLPALCNLHSHSFQRAMAGMTEFRTAGRDSFWTWRALMYRFLDRLTPDQISAIAALSFMEMQQAGYAAVGEFHYLHHAPGGQHYDDPAELSRRIMQAAKETGIGLTHLPVLYTYGDARHKPLAGGQLRFGNSLDTYSGLVDTCRDSIKGMDPDTRIGIAPHSLRAVSPDDLTQLLANTASGPVHMHIAEQTKEVDTIQSVLGARPVDWLLSTTDVDARWCLIHATHMTAQETSALATSGAVAGLCPVTEANLGDGVFNGPDYLGAGGRFGIGTDSNINISASEELRMMEYSQRLHSRARNVMTGNVMTGGGGSVGETLYGGAAKGGAQALDRNSGTIATGRLADLVAIDSTDATLCALPDRQILDGYVFAAKQNVVTDLWSAGRHSVRGGRHVAHDSITRAYRKAMTELTASLNAG